MAASKLGLLLWFRLLEGDLGGGGNGQHVDHALGDAGMHRVHGWVVTGLDLAATSAQLSFWPATMLPSCLTVTSSTTQ